MSDPTLAHPLRYEPSFEHLEEDEAATIADMRETFLKMEMTMADSTGHAMRSVHAKGHALLWGELEVLPGLPAQLAQGLFAQPQSYSVLLRPSSPPAEELSDSVSLPRAIAMKIIGVAGERLPGSEGDTTQDFLMVNGPVFGSPGPKGFLKQVKLVAVTTDKAPRAKAALSLLLRGTEKVVEALGGESGTLKSMGGHAPTHPLGETYFTQVPVLYGDFMAKLSLAPVSPDLLALKDVKLDLKGHPDAQREAVSEFFNAGHAGEWELRVQLCTNLERMPIEDASVQWPEEESPFVAVARLRVSASGAPALDEAALHRIEDSLSFNPWHGIAAHRPLGSVMRARKAVYEQSATFRGTFNGCPMHEPKAKDDVA